MIIQCEQCRTKFKLDDSRVKDNGVKVRCAKCRHIFTVRKEQPEAVQASEFETILEQTPAFSATAPPNDVPSQNQEDNLSDSRQQDTVQSFTAPQMKPVNVEDLDFSAFEAHAEPAATHTTDEAAPLTTDEIDFSTIDFSSTPADASPEDIKPSPFSDIDNPPPQLPPQEEFGQPISTSNQYFSATDTTTEPPSFDKPFKTDEIDFGEDLTVAAPQQEKAAEPKAAQEFIFTAPEEPQPVKPQPAAVKPEPEPAPVPPVTPQPEVKPAPVQPSTAEPDFGQIPPQVAAEEMPPLSIPSRRKKSPLLKGLLVLLLVASIAALGYYGKDLYKPFLPQSEQEAGKFTVRGIKPSFVKNVVTGKELLVISGEAVNSSTSPKAALQVKGIVYGNNGQVLASKNVYCGNPLSAEQLATLPMSAIEAAMANQLGTALMNLEVAPGKAIPFTVVIATVPEGAKDFAVEPAGSQAVAPKQK